MLPAMLSVSMEDVLSCPLLDSPVSSTSHHQELCPSFIQFVKMNKIDLHNHFQEFKYAHKHNFPLSHHS